MRRVVLSAILGIVAVFVVAQPAFAVVSFDDPGYPWPTVPATYVAGPDPAAKSTNPYGTASALSVLTVSDCSTILEGEQTNLVKQAQRIDNADGTVTLRVQLNTTLPPGETRLRDCLWVDGNVNSQWDVATETLYAVDVQPFNFLPDGSGGSFARFRVTVTATARDRICDRAARSEYEDAIPAQAPYLEKSNTLCFDGIPDPVVSEAALAAMLPVSAVVIGGGAWFLLRRRRASVAA